MLSSLRYGFIITTTAISVLICAVAFLSYSWFNFQQNRTHMEQRTLELAQLLAAHVERQLSERVEQQQENFAELLSRSQLILHAHVYRYNPERELEFQAGYNRPGTAPIAARSDYIEASSGTQLSFSEYGLDVIVPIELPQATFTDVSPPQELGYLFLRADTSALRTLVQRAALTALLVIIFSAASTALLASLLSRYFTRPLADITRITAEVARTRDYNLRVPRSFFNELSTLGYSINTMLDRIQQSIAQREKAEASAAQMNLELEHQVQERTTALRQANQELLETLEQLHKHQGKQVEVQKMSSLSELVAGISHEINTPLGMAVTASSMLAERIQSQADEQAPISNQDLIAEQTEQLAIVQRNLARAVELINNFKKMAIEHAGEEAVAVDFASLMEDIFTSAKSNVEHSKHIEINVTSKLQAPIMAKVGVWHQLLMSLFENSAIHGLQGHQHPHIDVRAEISNARLHVRYHDNGRGVPADVLRRIFDPFVTTKRGQGNSGLGMHLVYNLVTHTLKGSVQCDSEPGEGFTVVIECPFDFAS